MAFTFFQVVAISVNLFSRASGDRLFGFLQVLSKLFKEVHADAFFYLARVNAFLGSMGNWNL